MKTRPRTIIILLVSLFVQLQSASISGKIIDSKTDRPLAGVNILIRDSFIGSATANDGSFHLDGLKPGEYSLIITMIGYRKRIITVNTDHYQTIELEQDVLASPQVVVTGTRNVQDIMESPVAVSVIGPRDLASSGAVSMEEILPFQAGVSIVKDQINIRGANSYSMGAGNRSMLLLDGMPLLGGAAGNISWTVVPASEIERVEILKSSGSALYGSSAMGGVINIITRNAPAVPETRLRFNGGFYSTPKYSQWNWRDSPGLFHTAELTHARPWGDHGFWLRLQEQQTDGYYQLGWRNAFNLTGKIKFNFGSRYSASVYGNFMSEEKGLYSLWKNAANPFEAPDGYKNDSTAGTKFNLNGLFNYIYSPTVIMKLKAAYYDVRWQNSGLTNNDHSDERKYFSEYQIASTWNARLSTTSGISLQQATINSQTFGEHDSYSSALYFHALGHLNRKTILSLGARYETYFVDDQQLDQTLSPQAALNFRPTEGLSFRASIGHGFRVPTIAELFTASQLSVFTVVPNPDLKAETSIASELGATLTWPGNHICSGINFDFNLFNTSYNQMIEPVIFRADTIHFDNITDARISGAEIAFAGGLFNNLIMGRMAYTWLEPVALNSGNEITKTLSYRYRHSFSRQVMFNWKKYFGQVEYRYNSRMEEVQLYQEDATTGRDRRVPIHIWNMGAGYRSDKFEFQVRIENFFQYYYVELERNMGEERNLSLNIIYRF